MSEEKSAKKFPWLVIVLPIVAAVILLYPTIQNMMAGGDVPEAEEFTPKTPPAQMKAAAASPGG